MMEQDTSSELMNNLFVRNQCNVLMEIFLHLDPMSLKNCKLVNSHWCSFIDQNLWGSKTGRRVLSRRLMSQWKDKENIPSNKMFNTGQKVRASCLSCDNEIAVLGPYCGKASVHNLSTGELLCEMDCKDNRLGVAEYVRGVDIGQTVIATVTYHGTVSVWDRKSFSLLYKARHPGDGHVESLSLASDNCVLTGSTDGSLAVFENIDEGWALTKHVTDNKECVCDIASDGNMSAVGTKDHVKLFNIQTHTYVHDIPQITVIVDRLELSYPLVFIVGGHWWGGVQIWDVTTGLQVGETLQGGRKSQHIHVNKYFLIVSSDDQLSDAEVGSGEVKSSSVFLFDLQQVTKGPVSDSRCWKKHVRIPWDNVAAISSNTTSLILCRGYSGEVVVMDFWNLR